MTMSSSGVVRINRWWSYFFPLIRDTSDCVCVSWWWWIGWGRWIGGGRGVSKRRPEGVMRTTRMIGTL